MHQSSVINQSKSVVSIYRHGDGIVVYQSGNMVNKARQSNQEEDVNMSRNLLDRLGVSLACLESRSDRPSCFE